MKAIKQLRDKLQTKESKLRPRGEFKFKSREMRQLLGKNDAQQVGVATSRSVKTASSSAFAAIKAHSVVICGKHDERFVLDGVSTQEDDVLIENCSRCVIDLTTAASIFSAVHLVDCKDFILIARAISGSLFIDRCSNGIIVTGCHQFRMHTSNQVDCYLHVSSHPIIEDSTGIRFAKYPDIFEEYEQDLKAAKISPDVNMFASVNDFNWLKQQHSPNWSLIKEFRVNWDDILSGNGPISDLFE